MNISINANENLSYATSELVFFLNKYTSANIEKACENPDKTIDLFVDNSIPESNYSITGDGSKLAFVGGSLSAVLCAVYDALADAGIFFEATGYSVIHSFSLDTFFSVNKQVKPKFRLRGIRQHINFPMDVSSYSLFEAKEYIRSLARMRYNAITFHSYPGQWHEVNKTGEKDYAGHFFYGQDYPVPHSVPWLSSRVRNEKMHCIPEVESIYDDKEKRGDFAKYWLNELMKTAKEAYLTVTLSVEVTFDDNEKAVSMLNSVCKTYPYIDTLELLSEECGGFKAMPHLNNDNIKDFLVETFDEKILDENGDVFGLPDSVPHQLGATAISVKRILDALAKKDEWLSGIDKKPALRIGIYATCKHTLTILRRIMRERTPKDVTISLLPSHGSLAVAENIENTGTIDADWQNTMFYSWAEFDGNMFLQQLSTDGIEKLSQMPKADSVYGTCINHWRTSENNLTLSYASEALISQMPLNDYYKRYAKLIGVADFDGFAEACTKLASLDTFNRDNLFNIGFCAVECWLNWYRRGNNYTPPNYSNDLQLESISKYKEVIRLFKALFPSAQTERAIAFIRLMINRCQTSILHLLSLLELNKLFGVYDYDKSEPVTEEVAKKANEIIKKSRDYAMEYLALYGDIMADRGVEGHMISYYETTVKFIDAVSTTFNGGKTVDFGNEYDAPPMPDPEAR